VGNPHASNSEGPVFEL